MAGWPAESIDAIVCDPPYGLEFMGREWDAFRLDDPGTMRITEPIDRHAAPPTSLAFGEWCRTWALQAYRVAKPGAHLLAFGGTRTYHRLVVGLEDAGWEIRDCLVWAYAQGFPKSLNVGKAIDRMVRRNYVQAAIDLGVTIPGNSHHDWTKAEHAPSDAWWERFKAAIPESEWGRIERAVVGYRQRRAAPAYEGGWSGDERLTKPATEDAATWDGWGTALKPAWEPIILARKPMTGPVARNVLAHGTGALNIDGTRLPISAEDAAAIAAGGGYLRAEYDSPEGVALEGSVDGSLGRKSDAAAHPQGRWPANLALTDPIFDGDTPGVVGADDPERGFMPAGRRADDPDERRVYGVFGAMGDPADPGAPVDDGGTYSRFFLIPKATRSDREPVVAGELRPAQVATYQPTQKRCPECGKGWIRGGLPVCGHGLIEFVPSPNYPRENTHPTVKPTELMRHLVRLVTPPRGLVLDPFLGSGTTALAAEAEGFRWIGIERDAESVAIARARLIGNPRGLGLDVPAPD
ncbi:MAG: site-specific DNA-methyltransferase, partial [Chloroflexi bacterium]|nr:site-specific DNA-methyltransferase [Chloroflexota bacterium]